MKKAVKVLTTSALLASLAAPFAAPAYAAGNITALQTPTIKDDVDAQRIGAIKVVVPAGSVRTGDAIIVKLPSGIDFGDTLDGTVSTTADKANDVYAPANYSGDTNSLAGKLAYDVLDANDEIKIYATADQAADEDGVFYIQLNDIDTDNPSDGPVEVTFDAAGNTGFPTGKVTVANVNSTGKVDLSVSGADESNDTFNFDLRIKEAVAAALEEDNETLKLKLPSGFKWTKTGTLKTISGDDADLTIGKDDNELIIKSTGVTTQASYWEISGLEFIVDDESKAKDGDIMMTVSGETQTNISEVKVGTFGEFGAKVAAKSTPNVIAGRDEQEIGDINIKEAIGESLVDGRTITLTLPAGARWQEALKTVPGDLDEDSDEGITLEFAGFTGTNDRTAKYIVRNAGTGDDAADLLLENLEVALEAGFDGDLEVEVAGTAGVSGKIAVAKAYTPVTASVAEPKDVKIGLSDQVAGDFVITEKIAGALQDDDGANQVVLDLPAGVVFVGTPKIEVTEGDLRIENVRRTNGDNSVTFDVDSESTKASTIKVSGIKLKLDRTVAEGDVALKVQGSAAVETTDVKGWENSDTAAKAVIAKVTTPAPTDTTASNIVFKLNSKTFTVDGKEITMDAAPLVAWDRAFLPVRFAANALNVSDDNIIWDDKTSTATIFKGDRVITAKVGDKFLTVNGAKVPMDVPVYRSAATNNRVMIPVRYLSNALGADIQWNQETSEITIKAAK